MSGAINKAPHGYLTQDEAIAMLTPWVTCRSHIHQEWLAGRFGSEKKQDWVQVGRRRYYKESVVEDLLQKYMTKVYSPVRYQKTVAA